ncbi:hypothetical protein LXL04_023346 [Taraxacum kok-saghyz]
MKLNRHMYLTTPRLLSGNWYFSSKSISTSIFYLLSKLHLLWFFTTQQHGQQSTTTTTGRNRMSSSQNKPIDPVRKYGVQDPHNKTNFTYNFCGTVVKGGAFCLKQHLIGRFKDAKKCPNSPEHVKEELKAFMDNKQSLKAQQQMQQARFQLHEPDEFDDVDEEEVEICGSRKNPPPKKPRKKGPMDMYYTPNPHETVKARNRKGGKQQTINEVCRKDLRDKVCHEIGRWLYKIGKYGELY